MRRCNKKYDMRYNLSLNQKQQLFAMGHRAKIMSAEGETVKVNEYNVFDEQEQAFPLEWRNRNMARSLPIRDDIDLFALLGGNYDYLGRFILIMQRHMNNLGQIIKRNTHSKIYVPVSKKSDIYTLVEMKETAGRKFVKELEDKHLVKEYRGSYLDDKGTTRIQKLYYISPTIFRTARIHPDTYMLFREELDELLQPYCSQTLLRAWNIIHSTKECDNVDDRETERFLPPASSNEATIDNTMAGFKLVPEHLKTFCDALYGSNQPLFFQNYTTLINNPVPGCENLFFMVQPAIPGTKMHRNDAVREFRYVTLDVDIKKHGKALLNNELPILEEHKQAVYDILKQLPVPTATVKTRNGLQMIWKLSKAVSQEEWNHLQETLAITVGDFADRNAVKAGGILRCPGTYHKKEGTAPYPVQLINADDSRIYEPNSLLSMLSDCDISGAVSQFFADNPQLCEKKSPTSASHDVIKHTSSSSTDRIKAIKALSPIDISESTTIVGSLEEAKHYIKCQNIAEFLDIETNANGSFCCIFHDDRHPSAFIDIDKDGYSRYVCMSSNCELYSARGKSEDIFGVVQRLTGCSFRNALLYLMNSFKVRIENKKIA